MRLDGFGLLVEDMAKMIRFYRDVLGFEIKEAEDASNVYLVKDGTLFLLYGRSDFEKMTNNERLQRFWSWQGNEDYIYYDFFDNLLDECKKTYTRRNHEHRSNKGGH